MKIETSERSTWLGLLLLFVFLAILGALQFRWAGELSRVEAERLRDALKGSAERLAHEFDREVSRAFLQFRTPVSVDRAAIEEQARLALADWRRAARFPDMVSEVVLVDLTGPSPEAARTTGDSFRSMPWPPPADEARLLEAVESRRLVSGSSQRAVGSATRVSPELPGLVFPWLPDPSANPQAQLRRGQPAGFVLVLFDRRAIVERVLPALAEDLLTRDAARRPQAVSLEIPGEVPVRLDRGGEARRRSARDLTVPLFRLLPVDEISRLSWMRGARPTDLLAEARESPTAGVRYLAPWSGLPLGSGRPLPGWRLRLHEPETFLEHAVTRARMRNLGLGMGVLAVLGLSAVALVALSRRTRQLARRQLEFVAAVSHELRTPLAAIRALAQNLDDGVVQEPEPVRRYGHRIMLESGRLSDLVERTLELGGILAGGGARNRRPLRLDEVASRAIAECEPLAAQHGSRIELVCGARPVVSADPMALHGAVVNLIVNAVRLGAPPVTVEVHQEERRGSEVWGILTVTDHGPGIAKADLPHLFEPFFRGQNALARRIPGSGLGLSLVFHAVEAAGGTVEVESHEGAGAEFKLSLPVDGERDAQPYPAG